jgi:hypothetical protein
MKSSEFIVESAARDLAKKLPSLAKHDYDTIDQMVKQVSHRHGITKDELEGMFKSKYKLRPHSWLKKKLGEDDVVESYTSDIAKSVVSFSDKGNIYKFYSNILRENGCKNPLNSATDFINCVYSPDYRKVFENANPEIIFFYNKLKSHSTNTPKVKLKIGSTLCLLQTILDVYTKTIILQGFVNPKKISDISYYSEPGGKIKFITFEDGSTFPEKYEYSTTDFGFDLLNTMFFNNSSELEQTITHISMISPDGYRLGTGMLSESTEQKTRNLPPPERNPLVKKFVEWCSRELKLQSIPDVEYSYDTAEAQSGHHTGRHVEGSNEIWVYVKDRNLVDILRTIAHELRHVQQGEQGKIKPGSSYPFSPIEQDADRWAGGIIKIFGKQHPEIYQ